MRATLKIGLCFFALTATPLTHAEELGRLFFMPEQRAQLDYSYARVARPDGSNSSGLMLNGVVQRHGGKRTAWINGVPQTTNRGDDNTPASVSVAVPGQNKSVKLKVGQRVLLHPSVAPDTTQPDTIKPDTPNP